MLSASVTLTRASLARIYIAGSGIVCNQNRSAVKSTACCLSTATVTKTTSGAKRNQVAVITMIPRRGIVVTTDETEMTTGHRVNLRLGTGSAVHGLATAVVMSAATDPALLLAVITIVASLNKDSIIRVYRFEC